MCCFYINNLALLVWSLLAMGRQHFTELSELNFSGRLRDDEEARLDLVPCYLKKGFFLVLLSVQPHLNILLRMSLAMRIWTRQTHEASLVKTLGLVRLPVLPGGN